MATYYFHLCDGIDVLLDPDGRELEPGMLQASALAEARAIIAADVRDGQVNLDQAIEVKDSTGTLVHRTAFEDAITVTLATVRG